MKKLSILLIGLLLVTGFAFGQEEVTVSGEASLTFGVDLDQTSTGFDNAASSSISLDWLSGDASKGELAWISLSGWKISFASDDDVTVAAPSVSAGFTIDPMTITIYSAPSFEAGNAAGFKWHADDDPANEVEVALSANNTTDPADSYSEDGKMVLIEADDDIPEDGILLGPAPEGEGTFYWVPDTALGATETPGFQGLTVAFDLDVATVSLLMASDGTWAENTDNAYAFGGTVSTTVDPVTLNAGVYAGPTDALDLGFTVGADLAVDPVTLGIGFDGFMADGADDLDYDVSADLGVSVSGVSLTSNTYLWSVGGGDLDLDEQVVVDASGLVDGLTLKETFQMINVLSATELTWYSLTSVAYAVDGIKPYLDFGIDSATVIDVTAGVEMSGMVENTVFTLQYAVEDVENNNGAITFKTAISY